METAQSILHMPLTVFGIVVVVTMVAVVLIKITNLFRKKMKLYQVINKHGNPASYETINPEALFLTKDEAQAYIEFLKNECDLDVKGYKIICKDSLITTP